MFNKPNAPSIDEMWNVLGKTRHTPDAASIGRKQQHRVFIYSSMQTTMNRHGMLNGSTKHCVAFTQEGFSLWKKPMNLDTEAIAMQTGLKRIELPIKGELHSVAPSTLINLDNYHENGVIFQRRPVKLIIPFYTLSRLKFNEEREIKVYDQRYAEVADITSHEGYITKLLIGTTRAWMYVGTDYWDDQLDGGYTLKMVSRYEVNQTYLIGSKRSYYRFTPREYENK